MNDPIKEPPTEAEEEHFKALTQAMEPEQNAAKGDCYVDTIKGMFRKWWFGHWDDSAFFNYMARHLDINSEEFYREPLPVRHHSPNPNSLALLGWRIGWPNPTVDTLGSYRWCGLDDWQRKDRLVAQGAEAVELWGESSKQPSSGPPELAQSYRCQECNAPRQGGDGDKCFKCDTPLEKPCRGWEELRVPDIGYIRSVAKSMGFAISEHGTKEGDVDLVATPWVANTCSSREFIFRLAEILEARVVQTEDKAGGRFAATLQYVCGLYKELDISVAPVAWLDPATNDPATRRRLVDGVPHLLYVGPGPK